MNRWILDGWQIAVGPDIRILPGERASAEMLIVRHNADCDAYEAKIAELERRLDAYEPDAKSDEVHYKYDGKRPHDVRGWQP